MEEYIPVLLQTFFFKVFKALGVPQSAVQNMGYPSIVMMQRFFLVLFLELKSNYFKLSFGFYVGAFCAVY